jgi:hypothetical protein
MIFISTFFTSLYVIIRVQRTKVSFAVAHWRSDTSKGIRVQCKLFIEEYVPTCELSSSGDLSLSGCWIKHHLEQM